MTQAGLWWGAAACAALAVGAGWAEWRRSQRRDLDRVGVVPWGALSLLGLVAALAAVVMGVKG